MSHEFLPGKDHTTKGESSEVGWALPNLTQRATVKYVHLQVSVNPYNLISSDTITTSNTATRRTNQYGKVCSGTKGILLLLSILF